MSEALAPYPASGHERVRWTIDRRSSKNALDPTRPYACFVEPERSASGKVVDVATILLTNRECPFRCVMCDLYQNTLDETVPVGAIPEQIEHALAPLAPARQIKLYNSGSFFDPRAIPPDDYAAIAAATRSFERVIVESHTAFIGDRVLEFHQVLNGRDLEVAIGLETVHPTALQMMNKRMTVADFREAASFLRQHGISLRVFLMLTPPFVPAAEALDWVRRSIDEANAAGASVITLIPTRMAGAMRDLLAQGWVAPSTLSLLEEACDYGVAAGGARVFADLWDFEKLAAGEPNALTRRARLETMNLEQRVLPRTQMACA